VFIKDLHEDVRAVIDPQGRGRQFLTSAIRNMEGTRAAGFMLTCQRAAGKWGTATYSLRKTTETKFSDGCQEHRDHRGHRAEGQPLDNSDTPYAPYAPYADDYRCQNRRAAETPNAPMPPMVPMTSGNAGKNDGGGADASDAKIPGSEGRGADSVEGCDALLEGEV
jgi:hypothetical protein